MKEFLKNKKVTYNLMSFTGFKALILFSYLLESPKSYNEICQYFLEHPYLNEKISIDTLRVYITSLKRVGCEVKRARINGVSKYGILSNPFELTITPEHISSLVKVYKIISNDLTIEELLNIELFIKRLSSKVKNPEIFDAFLRISMLKGVDIELLQELINLSSEKKQIVFQYKSPRSNIKNIEVLLSNVKISNSKVYLYGYSKEYNQDASYLVSRIVKILDVRDESDIFVQSNPIIVGFEYSGDINDLELKDNEKIVQTTNNGVVVEISSSNEFLINQRILGFTDKAKVLYPETFKKQFVKTLKDMKAGVYIG